MVQTLKHKVLILIILILLLITSLSLEAQPPRKYKYHKRTIISRLYFVPGATHYNQCRLEMNTSNKKYKNRIIKRYKHSKRRR